MNAIHKLVEAGISKFNPGMWLVYDSSCCGDVVVAAFHDEEEALRFRLAYLSHNPEFFDDWVWLRFVPDASGPAFVDAQLWGEDWTW